MSSRIYLFNSSTLRYLALIVGLLVCSGCFFQDDDKKTSQNGGGWDDFPNAKRNVCGDISSEQMEIADSLLAKANESLEGEVVFLSGGGIDWTQLKSRDIDTLDFYYSKALEVAPHHCGALFGKSLINSYLVLQDRTLDTLVDEGSGTEVKSDFRLTKLNAENAAPILVGVRQELAAAPKSLVTRAQEVSENTLLPKLDSAIHTLEIVISNPDFSFKLKNENTEWHLDRGEVGPLLATLKFAKSVILIVAGYNWHTETDDSYPYWKTLNKIKMAEFDSLSQEQKAALDHYTRTVKSGSAFTRIRTGWASRVASIPTLLLEGVEDLQSGLEYGILQAYRGDDQTKDPYKVGPGENADIDPRDLQVVVDSLEGLKRYFRGETLITYAKGKAKLRINFPKLFMIDGIQGLLPYFEFYPYPEWNDSLPTDGIHPDAREKGPLYFTDAKKKKTLEGADIEDFSNDIPGLTGKIIFPDPTMGGVFPDLTNQNFWIKMDSLRFIENRIPKSCSSDTIPAVEDEPCELPDSFSQLDLVVYFLNGGFF